MIVNIMINEGLYNRYEIKWFVFLVISGSSLMIVNITITEDLYVRYI